MGEKGKLDKKRLIPITVLTTGIVMVLIYPLGIDYDGNEYRGYFSYAATSVLLAGASLLVGGFLGFLFGIPRTLQEQENDEKTSERKVSYRVNTNLEQISDWLTKILVGVGLTQLSSLPSGIQSLQSFFGNSFGPSNSPFSIIVLIYFVVCGFLLGYLATRLMFATALAHADTAALEALETKLTSTAERIEKSLTKREARAENDANALIMLDMQLDSSVDRKQVDLKELTDTLLAASPSITRQAFLRAQQI